MRHTRNFLGRTPAAEFHVTKTTSVSVGLKGCTRYGLVIMRLKLRRTGVGFDDFPATNRRRILRRLFGLERTEFLGAIKWKEKSSVRHAHDL